MDEHVTDEDLKRGIRAWSDRLHIPVTRMMSRVLREEIEAARRRRVAGGEDPSKVVPETKELAIAILRGEADARRPERAAPTTPGGMG
jgi:hypothetical protein